MASQGRDRAAELRELYSRGLITPTKSLNEVIATDLESRRALVRWLNGALETERLSDSWCRLAPITLTTLWKLALTETMELRELERAHGDKAAQP